VGTIRFIDVLLIFCEFRLAPGNYQIYTRCGRLGARFVQEPQNEVRLDWMLASQRRRQLN
jgi:hypothetical protein